MNPYLPKYSFIVPVYNSECSIRTCIESILTQTVIAFEIIIVDDGSRDGSFQIIEQLAKEDSRITLISKKNGGVASARNEGVSRAVGDYILFVDSDDYLDRRFLETYDDLLHIYPDALIYQSFVSQYNDEALPEVLPNQLYIKEEMPDCLILLETQRSLGGACNKIFNAKLIKDNEIRFNEQLHYGEDKIFTLQYLQFVDKIFLSDKCYYHYNRTTENSLSKQHHQSKELLIFSELEYKFFFELIKRYPSEELIKIINTRYSSFSKYILLSMYRMGDFSIKEDMVQLRKKIINFEKRSNLNKAFEVEVPQIINVIYKYDFLMSLAMSVRTKFSFVYNFFRK